MKQVTVPASAAVDVARRRPPLAGIPFRLPPIRPEMLLFAVLLGLFLYLIAPPAWIVLQTSFQTSGVRGEPGTFTLANYAELLFNAQLVTPLFNTVVFSVGSTVEGLIIGGSLAWLAGRTNTPLRGLGSVIAFTSLAVPYVLYTIAWLMLLGPRGPVNLSLMSWFGLSQPPINVNTLWAMTMIEGFLWSPLVFLLLSAGFRSMDPSLEEAASVSGANAVRVLRRVSLPLVRPFLLSTALLVFIRSVEAFEIPSLIGLPGRVYVLTTNLYQQTRLNPPEYGGASAYAVVLMFVTGVLLFQYTKLNRNARSFQTISGKGFRPRMVDLGPWKYLGTVAILVYFVLLIVLPLFIILWASFMPFYAPPSLDGIRLLSWKNYQAVFTQSSFASSMQNTVILGAGSATAVVAVAALASWVVTRTRLRGRVWLEQIGALPLVFPGVVLGLAVLQLYLRLPIPVYGTLWILGIAYLTRYLPYGLRNCSAGMLQVHQELEEAAAASGAGFWKVYRVIMLPLLSPVLIATWGFVFLISTKELSMAILLSGPRTQVMSVSFFELWSNGQVTEVAAFGTVWASAMAILVAVLLLIGRKYGVQFQQS